MQKLNLEQWVTQLLATTDQELSCSDCFDFLSEYVERKAAPAELDARMKQVEQHLGQCRVCREEYEAMRGLLAEEAGDAT